MKREVETDHFLAKTDTGKIYTIIQYQGYISTGSFNSPHGKVKGPQRLSTSTGLHVQYIDPETFKVIETDEVVRKV